MATSQSPVNPTSRPTRGGPIRAPIATPPSGQPATAPLPSPRPVAGASGGWQRELADAIRDPDELCRVLGLDPRIAAEARTSPEGFPLLVPRGFVARMRHGDPDDPLLAQVLPRRAEGDRVAGFSADPLDEARALAAPGLVHKYAGRALLLVTGGCAVHCRYCFRRAFPYAESGATPAGMDAAIDVLAADGSIREVILSGGDPLLLDDERIGHVVRRLEAIPHVRRLRVHTRLPVVLPSRVTAQLSATLAGTRLTCIAVVHANHPAELDDSVAAAMERLAVGRVLLFNQAVLLAGVNDSVEVLARLSERLVELRIVPYYLHMLDRVQGAAHFEVDETSARSLHDRLRATVPGYALPRLVREVAGAPAKTWLE